MISKDPHAMIYKYQMPNPKRCFMRKSIFIIDILNMNYQILKKNNISYWKNIIIFTYLIIFLYIKKENLYKKNHLRTIWTSLFSNKQSI